MRVTLEVVSGPHVGKRVVLMSGQSATFGRTPQADYQFASDLLMSGRHFAVELKADSCVVRDLDSRNGTFVDDKRVLERTISSGSVILAGETKFAVTTTSVATSQTVAAPAHHPQPMAPPLPLPPLAGLAASPKISSLLAAAPKLPPLSPSSASAPADGVQPLAVTKVATPQERWRAAASREYELALDDVDPIVRHSALLAAVWKGQKWALEYCRSQALLPLAEDFSALQMLAILGTPEDLPRVQAAGRMAELGPLRYALLGSFGNPQIMSDVLAGLGNEDEAMRAAASAAFTKMTGHELVPGGDAEPPDVDQATSVWRGLMTKHPQCPRWCRGLDVSRGVAPEALAQLDLESRFEACLRGRFSGAWKGTPLDREQLAERLHA